MACKFSSIGLTVGSRPNAVHKRISMRILPLQVTGRLARKLQVSNWSWHVLTKWIFVILGRMTVNEEESAELGGHTVVSETRAQWEEHTLPNWHSTPAGKQHYLLHHLGGRKSGPVLLFLRGASAVPTFSQKRCTGACITCCQRMRWFVKNSLFW